jgi:hypothetical protein
MACVSVAGAGGLLEWLGPLADETDRFLAGTPVLHLIIRHDAEPARSSLREFRSRAKLAFARGAVSASVVLHADTVQLADAWSQVLDQPVHVLPVPVPRAHLAEPVLRSAGEPLTFAFLGEARTEKGFRDVAAAIQTVKADLLDTERARFLVQCWTSVPGGESGVAAAVRSLARLPGHQVELIREPLSPEDYGRLMGRSDIVVLPYDAQRHRERASGVLVEAAASGRPVITVAGSLPTSSGPHVSGLEIQSADQLAEAVREAVQSSRDLIWSAQKHARSWAAWSDPSAFLKGLLDSEPRRSSSVSEPAERVVVIVDHLQVRSGGPIWHHLRRAVERIADGGREAVLLVVHDEDQDLAAGPPDSGMYDSWPVSAVAQARVGSGQLDPSGTLSDRLAATGAARLAAFDLQKLLGARSSAVIATDLAQLALVDSLALFDAKLCLLDPKFDAEQAGRPDAERQLRRMPGVPAVRSELLDRFDALLCLTEADAELVPASLSGRVHRLELDLRQRPAGLDVFAGFTSLKHMIGADEESAVSQWRDELEETGLDLFVWADTQHTGADETAWFLSNVYQPFLEPRGVSLALAGPVVPELVSSQPHLLRNVVLVHTDEAAFKAQTAARIVVEADGSRPVASRHLVAALEAGKPVVLKSGALATLPVAQPGLPHHANQAQHLVAQIMSLLLNSAARQVAAKATRDYVASLETRREPVRLWSGLVGKAFRRAGASAADAPAWPSSLIEWSFTKGLANRLISQWAQQEPRAPADVEAVRRISQTDESLLVTDMFDLALDVAGAWLHHPAGPRLFGAKLTGVTSGVLLTGLAGTRDGLGIERVDEDSWVARFILPRRMPFDVLVRDSIGRAVPVAISGLGWKAVEGAGDGWLADSTRLLPSGPWAGDFLPVTLRIEGPSVDTVLISLGLECEVHPIDYRREGEDLAEVHAPVSISTQLMAVEAGLLADTATVVTAQVGAPFAAAAVLEAGDDRMSGQLTRAYGTKQWRFVPGKPIRPSEPSAARLELDIGGWRPTPAQRVPVTLASVTELRAGRRPSLLSGEAG